MPFLSRAITRSKVAEIGLFLMPVGRVAQTAKIIHVILGRPLNCAQVSESPIHAYGSLQGVLNGISFAGTWTLEGGKYCRQFARCLTGAPIYMSVSAENTPEGDVCIVVFEGPGGRARFDIGR